MNEAELLSCIRNGQIDPARINCLKDSIEPADYTDGDPLQNAKYALTSFASRASMTAIEAGLPVRISRTIELQFIRMLSKCRKLTEVSDLFSMLLLEYGLRVHQCKENPELSESTLPVQDYIRSNLTNPISLADLAKRFGYTEYYLSRKFNQETGVRISDYLHGERIEYAKNLLLNTDVSIQEISQILQYGNFSYFGQLFRKLTGQTPQEYRQSPKKPVENN